PLLTSALSLFIYPLNAATPSAMVAVTVALSSWYGGVGFGVLATAVAIYARLFLLAGTPFDLHVTSLRTAEVLLPFAGGYLLLSWLAATFPRQLSRERMTNRRLAAREAELQALNEVAVASSGVLDPVELAMLVVDRSSRLAGAESSALAWHDPASGELRVLASKGGTPRSSNDPHTISSGGIRDRVFRQGESLIIDEFATWKGSLPRVVALGMRSAAAVPLKVGDRTVGTLTVASSRPRAFNDATTQLLSLFAAEAAPAIEAARLYTEARQHIDALGTSERALASSLSLL